MKGEIILSLCDYTGAWSEPFVKHGYHVLRIDPKHGGADSTAGTQVKGDMQVRPMSDGGWSLAATAAQLDAFLRFPSIGPRPPRAALIAALAEWSGHWNENAWRVAGVLMAPPCTAFAGSGAQWWPAKDANGETDAGVAIVVDCMRVLYAVNEEQEHAAWFALENPRGRVRRLVPEIGAKRMEFDPCDYAGWSETPERDAYTKKTCLYGTFDVGLIPNYREPVMYERRSKSGKVLRGSWMWAHLGGKSERTKALHSATPRGFARAFCAAQLVNSGREEC